MTNLFLHSWTRVSPSKYALNLRAFVIQILRELGVPFTPQCDDDQQCYSGPGYNPRSADIQPKSIEDQDVREAFVLMLGTIKSLQDRIAVLEAKV